MEQITEEMNVHETWYKEAHDQTVDSLAGFITHLMGDYQHDYGTVCHAIAASMMAAMYAANNTESGGITGFQASAVMWEVVKHINYSSNKIGLRIVDYDNMLYPQYKYKFEEKTLSPDRFRKLQKEAEELLKNESDHANPKVVEHWKSIVDGNVPFGYTIKEG